MYESNVEVPTARTYIQVPVMKFFSFIKKNFGGDAKEDVREMMLNHHCQMYNKESMFVFERFFGIQEDGCDGVWSGESESLHVRAHHYLKKYVETQGYVAFETCEEYDDAEVDCIFPGYHGILLDVTW
jgi:hypothetical protein